MASFFRAATGPQLYGKDGVQYKPTHNGLEDFGDKLSLAADALSGVMSSRFVSSYYSMWRLPWALYAAWSLSALELTPAAAANGLFALLPYRVMSLIMLSRVAAAALRGAGRLNSIQYGDFLAALGGARGADSALAAYDFERGAVPVFYIRIPSPAVHSFQEVNLQLCC